MIDPAAEHDPDEARADIRRTNAAVRALSHAMQGSDAGVAAAFDAYECEADPLGLPAAVAAVAAGMTPSEVQPAVRVAVDAAVTAWRASGESDVAMGPHESPEQAVRRIRGGIERAVWSISAAATSVLSDAGRLELADRLDGWLAGHAWVRPADPHYEDRLRRAACMMMLAEIQADAVMGAVAHELARRENRCRAWLPTTTVFDRASFIQDRHGPNPPARVVIDDLCAELVLLEAVPYLPDESDGPANA